MKPLKNTLWKKSEALDKVKKTGTDENKTRKQKSMKESFISYKKPIQKTCERLTMEKEEPDESPKEKMKSQRNIPI
ncbi:MAG: hypothetical protein PF503_04525 [Desulfobacula sp.]|nr:hypothetical protein [Desulfobacula sp.]